MKTRKSNMPNTDRTSMRTAELRSSQVPIERVSTDALFRYRITDRVDAGNRVYDIEVDRHSKSTQSPTRLRGFASQAAAMIWVDSHASSADLGEFAVLRAARAMHHWQRHEANQSVDAAAG